MRRLIGLVLLLVGVIVLDNLAKSITKTKKQISNSSYSITKTNFFKYWF